MGENSELEKLMERMKRDRKNLEKITKLHGENLQKKGRLLEEAENLGVNLNLKIPFDHLPEELQEEIERVRMEAKRDLEEIRGGGSDAPTRKRPRGIKV
jgi:hypothetical protein